ncbi:MAG: arginyl-tRNA--protein arginylyltransferase [Cytophagales bacterium]
MFADAVYPTYLSKDELDKYLENAWFRMGQTVFTTQFLRFNQIFYAALWLRIPVTDFSLSDSQKKLFKQNSRFSIKIKQAEINQEKEDLYAEYREHVSFDPSPSIQHLLFSDGLNNIFDTLEICIYDYNRLIACGFFDLGEKTIAGISCFYDPDYKKYSLGKYLMLQKMLYAHQQGYEYFYPGYFAPGYPLFDYKLNLSKSKTQYFDVFSGSWQLTSEQLLYGNHLTKMLTKLRQMVEYLDAQGIVNKLYQYEYYDANLIPHLNDKGLLDYPLFIFCFEQNKDEINPLIIFDIYTDTYKLIWCNSVYRAAVEENTEVNFCTHLLRPHFELFESDTPELMAHVIKYGLKMKEE